MSVSMEPASIEPLSSRRVQRELRPPHATAAIAPNVTRATRGGKTPRMLARLDDNARTRNIPHASRQHFTYADSSGGSPSVREVAGGDGSDCRSFGSVGTTRKNPTPSGNGR